MLNDLSAPLATAGLAMASVGLWTLRVALAARGRKAAGAIVAAGEAVVFALAFTRLASGLDAPERVVAYAVGVAVGTLLGLAVDERLSGGQSELRVVVPGVRPSIVEALHQRGWSATSLTAEGAEGPVTLLFVAAEDSRFPALVESVRRIVPEASWTVHRLGKPHDSTPPACFLKAHSSRQPAAVAGTCTAAPAVSAGPWRTRAPA